MKETVNYCMKKLENFSKSLAVLKRADFAHAGENEIYRMGVIGQFNMTLELAWKALQSALRRHGVAEAETGSPREIIQLGYKYGFLDDSEVWLLMLKKRNILTHVYNEDEADELVLQIRDSFQVAFAALEAALRERSSDDI